MLLLLLLLWGMTGVEGGPEATQGYSLNVKREVVVQEGLCVLIPCRFSYPTGKRTDSDPVHGYWFHSGANIRHDFPVATNNPQRPVLKRTQGRFFLLGDPQKNNCSLDIRETRKEDTGSYFFRLERGEEKYSYILNTMTLHVTDAPKNLTVTIYQGADPESITLKNGSSLSVSEGQSLRLFCSTDSYPPANLSWTWGNLSLCPSKLSKPGLLELFPVHLKHGGVYTCQAQHALGSQHISLSLHPQHSATLSEMTVGALVGAGATALLFLFCCILLLVVRPCRRPARPASAAPDPDALKGSVSQSPLVEPQADDSFEPLPPTVEAASSSTEEEVHYASLNFHEMKPRNPQEQQDTTEYSEIKPYK
ncbi:sialic acid-binding Ig-like lectin 12 isoform X2 [Onychomys torridus]|uniref:sialic acid-binding Ig-like lectin 12 isoform X2 n=1 Tax=Onychomys torridus TaxID=38674 RepID=UPI00167FD83F|nr:sialic acid-binding Ig-like lectin 12 isoform X2 [Onychomys torridus]